MDKEQLLQEIGDWQGTDQELVDWVKQKVGVHELNFVGVISGETAQLSQSEAMWANIGGKRYHYFMVCTKRPGQEVRSVPLNSAYIVILNQIMREYEESRHQKPDRQRLVLVPVSELS